MGFVYTSNDTCSAVVHIFQDALTGKNGRCYFFIYQIDPKMVAIIDRVQQMRLLKRLEGVF